MPTTLYIAEKKDIAMAIAGYLFPNGVQETKKTYLVGDAQTLIAWAQGHLLRNATPEEIDPSLKSWRNYHIYPKDWEYVPNANSEVLLHSIAHLLPKAATVVHAGDPDREGQYLIDEILTYCNYHGNVQRILINAKDDTSLKRAFDAIEDNAKYQSLYEAGLARNQADWLVGINLTRAYTETARKYGHRGVFRIGRVVVPTLALVVRREEEIQHFKSVTYYELIGNFTKDKITFKAKMVPDDTLPVDSEGRLLDEKLVDAIKLKLNGAPAVVETAETKHGKTAPPLPHSLDTLQVLANKRYGYSPKTVLDTVESLYMKKFVTYPRSDCQYIPAAQHQDARIILPMLQKLGFGPAITANPALTSKAWNDKKVSAHHAIIPTQVPPAGLDTTQQHIYELIAKQYCLQFYPPCEYDKVTFTIRAADVLFKGSGTHTTLEGWKKADKGAESEKKEDTENTLLPSLTHGDAISATGYESAKRKTTPPKRFTEGTLLQAMANIYRFISPDNPNRDKLKELKGIGTPATRDKIIANLLTKSSKLQPEACLVKDKQNLVPTAFGTLLIAAMDPSLTYPDTTAEMESELTDIMNGTQTRGAYLTNIITMVEQNIQHAEQYHWPKGTEAEEKTVPCPICGKHLVRRYTQKQQRHFWICENDECVSPATGKKVYYNDKNGEPVLAFCKACPPESFAPLSRWNGKFGYFWKCGVCGKIYDDIAGKPDYTGKKKKKSAKAAPAKKAAANKT